MINEGYNEEAVVTTETKDIDRAADPGDGLPELSLHNCSATACLGDEDRPLLSGARLHSSPERGVKLMATDSIVLAVVQLAPPAPDLPVTELWVPGHTLARLERDGQTFRISRAPSGVVEAVGPYDSRYPVREGKDVYCSASLARGPIDYDSGESDLSRKLPALRPDDAPSSRNGWCWIDPFYLGRALEFFPGGVRLQFPDQPLTPLRIDAAPTEPGEQVGPHHAFVMPCRLDGGTGA